MQYPFSPNYLAFLLWLATSVTRWIFYLAMYIVQQGCPKNVTILPKLVQKFAKH